MKITPEQQKFVYGPNIFYLPGHMIEGLQLYINDHIKQGSFLHAVLCNNLREAIKQADTRNVANIPAFVNFLCNYAPAECWGSPEKVEKWINDRKD